MYVRGLSKRRSGSAGTFEVVLPELRLGPGDFCALVGPSGSGKSTLLDLLGLVLAPSEVERFALHTNTGHSRCVVDVARLWESENDAALAGIRRRSMGYVLQSGGLFSFLSVGANVDLPRRLCGQRVNRADTERRMRRFGLDFGYDKSVNELSGGERQRVAILRALAHAPGVVLADEPTAAVDRPRAIGIVSALREYTAESGAALVMVTHDLSLVDAIADRAMELVVDPDAGPRLTRYLAREDTVRG